MSFLSNLIKKVAPIVATVAPGTVVGTAAAAVTYGQAKQESKTEVYPHNSFKTMHAETYKIQIYK